MHYPKPVTALSFSYNRPPTTSYNNPKKNFRNTPGGLVRIQDILHQPLQVLLEGVLHDVRLDLRPSFAKGHVRGANRRGMAN